MPQTKSNPLLILASSSPQRVQLLEQICYYPNVISPADIDETPKKGEKPSDLALRLALEKALRVKLEFPEDVILAADTVAAVGRLILPKALNEDDARYCIGKISGRRHRVYTGVCVIYNNKTLMKVTTSIIKIRKITEEEIEMLIASQSWKDKAGGCSLRGFIACFVTWLSGSDSNIVGLPLYETYNLLKAVGLKPFNKPSVKTFQDSD